MNSSQPASIRMIFDQQKCHHFEIRKSTSRERIEKLRKLKTTILTHSEDLQKALYQDYRKAAVEVKISEIYSVVNEIDFAIRHLKKWMKPLRVGKPLLMLGSKSEIYFEPKGVVLIIGPWNYPFSLVINPLISAIAAGNCAIIKPSELTPQTSHLIQNIIQKCFPKEEVSVFEGGAEVSKELLQLPFDHFFFTGSTRIGKIVVEAAAKHLAPVTLELGGKSPVIIDETADLKQAAHRLSWGKFLNAGQTCVAPDYIFLPESKLNEFVAAAKEAIVSLYGPTEEAREQSQDFCRIINQTHYERLKTLLQQSINAGAKTEMGGKWNDSDRYMSPTLLTPVKTKDPIMQEEIFGPILPILTYRNLEEVYSWIYSQEKPLALYLFSQDRKWIRSVLKNTTAGGTCVNSTLVHLINPHLPFGGIGSSGMGNYHGYAGFKTFSHERAVHHQGPLDSTQLLYPPYKRRTNTLIDLTIRFFTR